MYRLFCRQLAFYARYHRDPRNCATHYLGIPMLFLAAILPLQASHVAVGSFRLPLGILLTLPAVIGWIALDFGVGATLLLLLCPLFAVAELIADTCNALLMWSTAIALFVVGWCFQFLGHAVFERRRPAFVDDLSQTLIGPMFVVAKMLVWFGLRRDLKPFLAAAPPLITAHIPHPLRGQKRERLSALRHALQCVPKRKRRARNKLRPRWHTRH